MTHLVAVSVLWAINAPVTYVIIRRDYRGCIDKWTRIDRIFWGFFCLLYGPILLVVALFAILAMKVSSTEWAKREVRW